MPRLAVSGSLDVLEWYCAMQLSEREMNDYREIFELVDMSRGGSIDEARLVRGARLAEAIAAEPA